MTGENGDQISIAESSLEISHRKIDSLKKSFDEARPKLRELLGIKDGEPDTFFIGVFGSAVQGKVKETSDVDGYLFYKRGENTPATTINYDLEQCFDSPSSPIFGVPRDRKPPNPDGEEDIEAHDITQLVDQIANNEPLREGKLRSQLKEIAIIFSPEVIGDSHAVNSLRDQIKGAMEKRIGEPFNQKKFQELWDKAYGPARSRPRSHTQEFADGKSDGPTTWKSVQEEYKQLFGQPMLE